MSLWDILYIREFSSVFKSNAFPRTTVDKTRTTVDDKTRSDKAWYSTLQKYVKVVDQESRMFRAASQFVCQVLPYQGVGLAIPDTRHSRTLQPEPCQREQAHRSTLLRSNPSKVNVNNP